MAITAVGSIWLRDHFGLKDYQVTHKSYIGSRNHIELSLNGDVIRTFGPKYAPDSNSIFAHLEFALKYDDLSLDLFRAIFEKIETVQLTQYVASRLTGKYTRKIGFLYEWLTGREIQLLAPISGNYVDLLEPDRYITGQNKKNARWRVNDNLLGDKNFCPVVRRTSALQQALKIDLQAQIEKLKKEHSSSIFQRAIVYLYRKETKSSYEIERENPPADRMDRFISLLSKAGTIPSDLLFSEEHLTALQNEIVDARFAVSKFRDFQNYIGQSSLHYGEIYHYICPPPFMVKSMMSGLRVTEQKSAGNHAIIRAAIIAFGFVFIHPFEDGNGRLHRFLVHDILARDGVVQRGLIIPISARMIHHIQDYDTALETFSKPLMKRIRYESSSEGEVTVTNTNNVESCFRYPDLTFQCVYLANIIEEALSLDVPDELMFLQKYDELKKVIQNQIDMPDRELNQLMIFLHQNKGIFPNRRKVNFPKLNDDEYLAIQHMYTQIFS